MKSYEKEKTLLLKILREGSALAQSHFPLTPQEIIRKKDGSLVTVMDYACQAFINSRLLSHFPEDNLLCEEEAELLEFPEYSSFKKRVLELSSLEKDPLEAIRKGRAPFPLPHNKGRFWVVDPIDGTRGFIEGEQYALAIALIEEGRVVVAGLGCPRLSLSTNSSGVIVFAVHGEGAWGSFLDRDSLFALKVNKKPQEIIYCEPPASSSSHSHASAEKMVNQVFGNTLKKIPYPLDSQCKYALVASGLASLYLRIPSRKREEKIWDHAPGSLIVQEAGGQVSDLRGSPLDFTQGENLLQNEGLLVSNGVFHASLLEAYRTSGGT